MLVLMFLFQCYSKVYKNIKMGSKCRNLPLLCTGVFCLNCKKQGRNVTQLLDLNDLSHRDLFDCLNEIRKVAPALLRTNEKQ